MPGGTAGVSRRFVGRKEGCDPTFGLAGGASPNLDFVGIVTPRGSHWEPRGISPELDFVGIVTPRGSHWEPGGVSTELDFVGIVTPRGSLWEATEPVEER